MLAVDSYERMISEINKRDSNLVPTTVGILLVDYKFDKADSIIQPALTYFNQMSGNDINFYLPGYLKKTENPKKDLIYKDDHFIFDREEYQSFWNQFSKEFQIEQTFSPTLVLFEYTGNNFANSDKIIIDLSTKLDNISQFEDFFKTIFQNAKKNSNLKSFSNALQKKELKNFIIIKILEQLEKKFLIPISSVVNHIFQYRIR